MAIKRLPMRIVIEGEDIKLIRDALVFVENVLKNKKYLEFKGRSFRNFKIKPDDLIPGTITAIEKKTKIDKIAIMIEKFKAL